MEKIAIELLGKGSNISHVMHVIPITTRWKLPSGLSFFAGSSNAA